MKIDVRRKHKVTMVRGSQTDTYEGRARDKPRANFERQLYPGGTYELSGQLAQQLVGTGMGEIAKDDAKVIEIGTKPAEAKTVSKKTTK